MEFDRTKIQEVHDRMERNRMESGNRMNASILLTDFLSQITEGNAQKTFQLMTVLGKISKKHGAIISHAKGTNDEGMSEYLDSANKLMNDMYEKLVHFCSYYGVGDDV